MTNTSAAEGTRTVRDKSTGPVRRIIHVLKALFKLTLAPAAMACLTVASLTMPSAVTMSALIFLEVNRASTGIVGIFILVLSGTLHLMWWYETVPEGEGDDHRTGLFAVDLVMATVLLAVDMLVVTGAWVKRRAKAVVSFLRATYDELD